MKVVGIDILPHQSPSSQAQPRYAVVIIDNGKITTRLDEVSFTRLLRLIHEEEPEYVAVDNLLELGEDMSAVVNFIRNFPPGTKLVQVTRINGSKEYPLSFLARLNGIPVGDKLSPLQAAEVAALLVLKGIGSIVKIHDEKTMIVVSRARTLKAGGMSRERYLRHVHTLILRITKKVKEALDKAGLDYDYFYRKTVTGLEGSVFIVYTERKNLYGIVRPMKGHDVSVTVKPIERQKVAFVPLKGPKAMTKPSLRYVILGVDPGIVTGIAIVDIEGRPLVTVSKRYFSRGDIINLVYEYGTPVLIATDVPHPPAMVKKLASTLNVPLFTPHRTLSVAEKERLVQEYLERYRENSSYRVNVANSHQRDALASAIKAFLSFKPKLEQVEAKVRELGVDVPLREVKALVLQGKSIMDSVNEVLRRRSSMSPRGKREVHLHAMDMQVMEQLRTQVKKQSELIDKLLEERQYLYEKINDLQKRIEQLESLLDEVTREQALKLKENKLLAAMSRRVEELQAHLSRLKGEKESIAAKLNSARDVLKKIAIGDIIPMKYIRALTRDSVNEGCNEWGITADDVLLVLDSNVASQEAFKRLKELGVRALICMSPPPGHVQELAVEYELPLVTLPKERLSWFLQMPLISDPHDLERLIRKAEEEIRDKARLRNIQKLKRIVSEYRNMRVSDLSD